ncbi:MAG: hypothetical protein DMF62_04460 [Acidobacteria bacterium]|nr:MAG: hypothetical protein DMF62_04460 [Acidobacteriota bacterium]
MNLPRIYLIAILLLAFGVGAPGQEPPKAVLVDEFGRIPCEDLLARLDVFVQGFGTFPNDQAIVVTFPEDRDPTAKSRTKFVLSRFESAQIEDRLKLYLGKPNGSLETQFWRLPPGANFPNAEATQWYEPKLDLRKPFVFGYEDENQICPIFVPRKFGELIMNNPGSKAHFVRTSRR